MADKSCSGDFFAGFMVGALLGAAAALLFAPQTGEQTRTLIRERGIELKGQADELSVEARKRAEVLQEQARERAGGLSGQAKERARNLQSRVQQAVEEGKAAATTKKEELLSRLDEQPAPDEVPDEAPPED
jgi:gas vesicle protein